MKHTYVPKCRFTAKEDVQLNSLIEKYGVGAWDEISAEMQTRTPRQCRERWTNYLCPKLSNAPWTDAEDEILDDLYQEFGSKWTTIAEYFPNRSPNCVRNRIKLKLRKEEKENEKQKIHPQIPEQKEKKVEIPVTEPSKPNTEPQQTQTQSNLMISDQYAEKDLLQLLDDIPELTSMFN